MKSGKALVVPILFLIEGAFWIGTIATGGALLLVLAALAFLISGVLLIALPENWAARPMAGASALLGLTLTLYQVYEATTLFGTGLSSLGYSDALVFGAFAVLSVYLELAALSMGKNPIG